MSNYLSIAVVTATLQQMIQEVLEEVEPGATVRVGPPKAPGPAAGPEVDLYLYMLSPNASLRNQDLPTRSSQGVLEHRPVVAVDLHYVISFYGEQDLASERMLGKIASRFNAHPILTPQLLKTTLRNTGSFPYLAGADLPDETTVVRLNPYFATLDELSKLWTVFFQMAHRMSLQYIAGPVLIDADESPKPPVLVTKRNIATTPDLSSGTSSADAESSAATKLSTGSSLVPPKGATP
jgi:hypothetical protein